MKKIIIGFGLGVVILGFLAQAGFAQTVQPSVSGLLAAVTTLQQIESARQSILNQVNLQFAQISDEVANLPALPTGTGNETAARAAELSAIAAKLSSLNAIMATLNQIEATEASLSAEVQAQMQSLGIQ